MQELVNSIQALIGPDMQHDVIVHAVGFCVGVGITLRACIGVMTVSTKQKIWAKSTGRCEEDRDGERVLGA